MLKGTGKLKRIFLRETLESPDCCSFEGLLPFGAETTLTKPLEADVVVAALLDGLCLAPTTPTSRFMAPNVPADLEPGEGTWIGSDEEQQSSTPKLFFPDAAVSTVFWLPFPETAGEPTNDDCPPSDCSNFMTIEGLTSLSWA